MTSQAVPLLHSPLLAKLPHVAHGFTTRAGGTSAGFLASLNLSTRIAGCEIQDERATVLHNRERVVASLSNVEGSWVSLRQVHGDTIVEVTAAAGSNIEADGLFTRDKRAVVAVLVGDCVPLLMADEAGRAVAAVHAGWRGTRAHIAARMLERLSDVGIAPSDMHIALGPAIGPCCYSVRPDVAQALLSAIPQGAAAIVKQREDQYSIDLWELNVQVAVQAGVALSNIETLRVCTACTPDFYSHRRDHGKTGRQAGVIRLLP